MIRECFLGREDGVKLPGLDKPAGPGLLVDQAKWIVEHKGCSREELYGAVSVLRSVAAAHGWPLGSSEPCSLAILASKRADGSEDWSRFLECVEAWRKSGPPAEVDLVEAKEVGPARMSAAEFEERRRGQMRAAAAAKRLGEAPP